LGLTSHLSIRGYGDLLLSLVIDEHAAVLLRIILKPEMLADALADGQPEIIRPQMQMVMARVCSLN
jgi:hypothetical protein